MLPTPAAISDALKARWEAHPETEGVLSYIVTTLTAPESDGISMIERAYRSCDYRNQRNAEVWAAGSAFLQKRFKNKSVYFAVDCPDEGHVTFHLAIADSPRDVHATPQAHRSWNVNLLKPKDEWVIPPIEILPRDKPRPAANTPSKPIPPQPAKPARPEPGRRNLRT